MLFPFVTISVNYVAVMAAHLASVWRERRRVTDVFGRFLSAEVRDAIANLALRDPDLIRPGGRQMEITVLFADNQSLIGKHLELLFNWIIINRRKLGHYYAEPFLFGIDPKMRACCTTPAIGIT